MPVFRGQTLTKCSEKQLSALRYLIAMSKHGRDELKKILWLLIEASEGLTKEVYYTLHEEDGEFSSEEVHEISVSLHGMASSNGQTHLHALMNLSGSPLNFQYHYGHVTEGGEFNALGIFPWKDNHPKDAPMRYTIFLTEEPYRAENAKKISPSREEIEAVNLSKPGLYPILER